MRDEFKCIFCGGLNSINSLRNTNIGKNSYGSISYNLTISETAPFAKTLYGLKAKITEKNKAFLMLDKIQSDFSISDWDIMKWRKEILEKEYKQYKEMNKQHNKKAFNRD